MDISANEKLFGPAARLYGPVIAGIILRLDAYEYKFIDNETFESALTAKIIGMKETNLIVAEELLVSAHLAACTSILRADRWFNATWREYEAGNLLGWAACCRSLLEATGDALFSLRSVASTIAENKTLFHSALCGSLANFFTMKELEDALIHFSHARKLNKGDAANLPDTHSAKQTTAYVDMVERAAPKAKELYSELCQLGHPASSSLNYIFNKGEAGGFKIDLNRENDAIADVVNRYRDTLHQLPSLAFNPGLLILRVLVPFKLFPNHAELRRFEFQSAAAWVKIKPMLAR